MIRLVSVVLALVSCLVGVAHAETYRMSYQAVVLGVVELGAAEYEVTDIPAGYTVRSTLRTSGLARLFDQTDITASASGVHVGEALSWSRYALNHTYGRKRRQTALVRSARGVAATISPAYWDQGFPPATAEQQSDSFDPLSAVFVLGRRVGLSRGCEGSVLVFDGRQHYRLSVAPRSNGTYNGGGYEGPAVLCQFRYTPISGFSRDFDRAGVPLGQIWFAMPARPGFAPPLQLIVPTPLGEGQLNLASYQRRN
ncbi:MAG: DUF3108 domain-containing protein [Hyphomonadaceae bacterium]|nr:DUF3108 domain-containing protein [Hyphomonadaceae bacterium]